ncbi:PhoH family protein [Peptoniphilus sp. KCTC 25270]|uniref:PhoH family protein n=1 Tax=Peptoniphilus sp. KCTC 25270 TaxID=2897414 RepID=UPI001E2FE5DB|nr:PhoH family protein [Peptoniphilus sp. KCTC 25270]MCD1146862.1 PhoH family protein [Peptoniphilus sp. KCTC 25270]
MTEQIQKTIEIENTRQSKELFGELDANVKKLEEAFSVQISNRDQSIEIVGEEEAVRKAEIVLENLKMALERQKHIELRDVEYSIDLVNEGIEDSITELLDDVIVYTEMGRPLRPKTLGQKRYLDAIRRNDIVFGIGPAGTGKTYIAMANAVKAFKNKEVNRIILTRPAVEAGESLGFLPGDLQMKVDPYLRPLYDALFEIMGHETFNKYMEKGMIEVAPLAYMRGRTLDNSYVILDEAQNTTNEQMKMFLTRLGYGSKAIITGDITQIDLPRGKQSGLKSVLKILKGVKGIEIVRLGRTDIVRHPLVQRIIDAYEKADREKEEKEKKKKPAVIEEKKEND